MNTQRKILVDEKMQCRYGGKNKKKRKEEREKRIKTLVVAGIDMTQLLHHLQVYVEEVRSHLSMFSTTVPRVDVMVMLPK